MSTETERLLSTATTAINNIDPDNLANHVGDVAAARDALDQLLNEAAAQATLSGASLRAVAHDAGLSPNAIGPRLAGTSALRSYATPDGRVTASGIERARYDNEREPSKFTFTPRKPTNDN